MANRNRKTKKENRVKRTAAAADKVNDRLPQQKITDTLLPAEQITPEKARDICEHDHSILLAQQATLFDDLNGYEDSLEKLVAVLEDDLKKYPDGFLRIDAKGAAIDFYYYDSKERGGGKYLPYHSNEELIHDLCQKSYDRKLLTRAKKALRSLQRWSSQALSPDFSAIYDTLASARKLLVSPRILPDEKYIEYWKRSHRTDQPFYEEKSVYLTQNNERVRSKSEVIIANTLSASGVPYVYEPVLSFGQAEFRPDFIVLNVRTRTEYYWEHLGMLDDEDYANHSYRKIAVYEKNGIIPGINLILSFESASVPLDIRVINNLIRQFCV